MLLFSLFPITTTEKDHSSVTRVCIYIRALKRFNKERRREREREREKDIKNAHAHEEEIVLQPQRGENRVKILSLFHFLIFLYFVLFELHTHPKCTTCNRNESET